MSRYQLIGYEGQDLGLAEAATMEAAERDARARGLRVMVATPFRPDRPASVSARNDAPDLVAIAEARLAEAFSRLGLSDRQAEQAVLGRDASPLERARVDRLREGLVAGQAFRGDAPHKQGINVNGRQLVGMVPGEPQVTGPVRRLKYRGSSGGWDIAGEVRRREAQAQTAETAGALVRAGYDPNDVARTLGLPLRHTGAPPVTVQATEPTAPAAAAPAPVAAAEAARRPDRGEDVELREVTSIEDRIGDALGRAFGLTEAERDHASRGR